MNTLTKKNCLYFSCNLHDCKSMFWVHYYSVFDFKYVFAKNLTWHRAKETQEVCNVVNLAISKHSFEDGCKHDCTHHIQVQFRQSSWEINVTVCDVPSAHCKHYKGDDCQVQKCMYSRCTSISYCIAVAAMHRYKAIRI